MALFEEYVFNSAGYSTSLELPFYLGNLIIYGVAFFILLSKEPS
jgi:hypothetical protein